MKTRVSLKYFVNDCLWKKFFASNLSQTPSNLIFDNFGNSKVLHSFNLKIEQLSCKKVLKFVPRGNWFSGIFPEVEIRYQKTFKFVLG